MTSRQIRSSFLLPLALSIAGISAAQTPPPKIPRTLDIPDNALMAAGKAPEVAFLYTGDVIGYIEDCGCHLNPAGGLTRRSWVLNQLRTNYPATPIVSLDSGNFSDNPTEIGDLRTAALLQAMKRLGYRVVNIGERDMMLGYDDFVSRTKGLGMAFVSTNIVKQGTKEPVFPPSTVFEVRGTSGKPVRIGVLGVARYNPVWQKAGPDGTNLGMASPAGMIGTYLPELRKKSDIVILLAAISKEDAHDLAKQFPDIDMVLGAYAGVYNTVEETEGHATIVYTGNQGKRLGESRITLDADRHIADVTSYLHFLTVNYPEDQAMKDSIAAVLAKTAKPEEPKKPDAAAPAGGH